MATPVNIMSLDRKSMENFFIEIGEQPFRAKQVLQWIYQRNVTAFPYMTDLSKSLRSQLESTTSLKLPEVAALHCSTDGTVKWLIRLEDGNCIETVYIPEPGRGTLCVSSQVGCSLNCTFCATAQQGFNRNLRVDEIIAQVCIANNALQSDDNTVTTHSEYGNRRPVTNIVLMGMGEPLLNLDNVISAMRLMMDDYSFGLSWRRVTLSTAGLVPGIDKLKEQCKVALAVSLHAPDNELRNKLVPLNKKYPIGLLLESCKRYVKDGRRERVTFEYVMLQDINDSEQQAKQLAGLLHDIPCKVNLIPFNSFPGNQFKRSDADRIRRFGDILLGRNIITVVRKTRGEDIDAACGQLAGDFTDRTRRSQRMKQQLIVFP